jgi:hypothetical protein
MKRVYLLFWLFCAWNAAAQKPTLQNTFDLKAYIFVGYDALGAIYSITNNVLTKQMGTQKWQYKNPQLGKIAKVDLQNPLKIVLFYQGFNTIILVDNQLNETANINLNDSANPIIAMGVGLAAGNRLWIYNNVNSKIGLYDYSKRELKILTVPFSNNVKSYCSDFNFFQWVDELGNLYRCDVYGKIKTLGLLPDSEQIQLISDSVLLYRKGSNLYKYNLTDKKETLLEIDEKTFKNFSVKDQILSIFTDHGITNYKIAVP